MGCFWWTVLGIAAVLFAFSLLMKLFWIIAVIAVVLFVLKLVF